MDIEQGRGVCSTLVLRHGLRLLDVPPAHQLDDLLLAQLGHVSFADFLSIFQHDDAIGDLGQLSKAMGDVQNTAATPGELPDEREQLGRLGLGQNRGGLIQDEDPRV